MNRGSIIKSLNLTAGDILTLDKAKDRMEFEVLPIMGIEEKSNCPEYCRTYCPCLREGDFDDCKKFCFINYDCGCKGPVGYVPQSDCNPYTVCPTNADQCKPVGIP